MICTKCHKEKAEWDFGNEAFCQLCWEQVTSDSWWEICAPYWVEPVIGRK